MLNLFLTFITAKAAQKISSKVIGERLVSNICKMIAKMIKQSCNIGENQTEVKITEDILNSKDLKKIIKKFEKLGYDIEVSKIDNTLTIKLRW